MKERRQNWPIDTDPQAVPIPGPPAGTKRVQSETATVCDCGPPGEVWADLMFSWGRCPACGHCAQINR